MFQFVCAINTLSQFHEPIFHIFFFSLLSLFEFPHIFKWKIFCVLFWGAKFTQNFAPIVTTHTISDVMSVIYSTLLFFLVLFCCWRKRSRFSSLFFGRHIKPNSSNNFAMRLDRSVHMRHIFLDNSHMFVPYANNSNWIVFPYKCDPMKFMRADVPNIQLVAFWRYSLCACLQLLCFNSSFLFICMWNIEVEKEHTDNNANAIA